MGNTTVVIDTDEYDRKINDHLSDNNTYSLVNADIKTNSSNPNRTLVTKVNNILKKFKEKKTISEVDCKFMCVNSPTNPFFTLPLKFTSQIILSDQYYCIFHRLSYLSHD